MCALLRFLLGHRACRGAGGRGGGHSPVYTRGCNGEQDLTGALFLAFAALHSGDLDKEKLRMIITCE